MSLWPLLDELKKHRWVDLTHPFSPHIPHWSGYLPEQREPALLLQETGFSALYHRLVGAYGTHVDAPSHMHAGGRSVDQIRPEEMLLPLVVIDISAAVRANPDSVVRISDIEKWERIHGMIPPGSFVALRSDWSKRWPDPDAFFNRDADGIAHTPGWSLEVLRFLYEERQIVANGHETGDPDPGSSTSRPIPGGRPLPAVMHEWYACESYILATDHYEIEMLTNLDQVPASGAIAWVSFPKVAGGPNFPARVLALCPNS